MDCMFIFFLKAVVSTFCILGTRCVICLEEAFKPHISPCSHNACYPCWLTSIKVYKDDQTTPNKYQKNDEDVCFISFGHQILRL